MAHVMKRECLECLLFCSVVYFQNSCFLHHTECNRLSRIIVDKGERRNNCHTIFGRLCSGSFQNVGPNINRSRGVQFIFTLGIYSREACVTSILDKPKCPSFLQLLRNERKKVDLPQDCKWRSGCTNGQLSPEIS